VPRASLIVVAALAAILGCQRPEQCTLWWETAGLGGARWGDCGDKEERKIECDTEDFDAKALVRGPQHLPPLNCACMVDGVTGKRFETTDLKVFDTRASATRLANEQCGWHITP